MLCLFQVLMEKYRETQQLHHVFVDLEKKTLRQGAEREIVVLHEEWKVAEIYK